jgi:hypothetical protein
MFLHKNKECYYFTAIIYLFIISSIYYVYVTFPDTRVKPSHEWYDSDSSAPMSLKSSSEDEPETEPDPDIYLKFTNGDLHTLQEYSLIYLHPETIFVPAVFRKLRAMVDSVGCVAIDEVHCIVEWGKDFRTAFTRLGDLVSIFNHAAHIALTATATPQAITSMFLFRL